MAQVSDRLTRSYQQQCEKVDTIQRAASTLSRDDNYYRAVLEALPVAIYATDAEGRIVFYNDAAVAIWGRSPVLGDERWCGSWKLYRPDGSALPYDQYPMAVALKERRPVRGVSVIAERPDGSRVSFMPFPTPLYDAVGTLIGAVNMLMDLADRDRTTLHEQKLAAIIKSSDDAILSKDLNGIIESWNRGAERLFGYTADEAIGKPVTILIPSERHNEKPEILARIRRGEHVDHYETVRQRKDGTLIDISLSVSPIRNAEGRIVGASKIARDITDRRRAQEQQALLLGEIKHRIKNSLATVQAIASQTLHSISEAERTAFFARLQALAGAHDLLTLERWNRTRLHEVVNRALEPFDEMHHARFLVEGSDQVWIDANKSLLLAMTLHELATNAIKYGALSNSTGRVHVSWNIVENDDQERLRISWRESDGPMVQPPTHKGFGSRLITRALNGNEGSVRMEFLPQGLICTLEMIL